MHLSPTSKLRYLSFNANIDCSIIKSKSVFFSFEGKRQKHPTKGYEVIRESEKRIASVTLVNIRLEWVMFRF